MSAKQDDLEAIRTVVSTLEPFPNDDRERIMRWAREKLGMAGPSMPSGAASAPPAPSSHAVTTTQPQAAPPAPAGGTDIRAFVAGKSPKSEVHLAVTVAYYYEFEAPEAQRKEWITKDDLVEACRRTDRKRPTHPAQVLVNAYHEGLLDRGERGQYKLNAVGENLVAMVLPGTQDSPRIAKTKKARPPKQKKRQRSSTKR